MSGQVAIGGGNIFDEFGGSVVIHLFIDKHY
jgi:hypothetical protein